MQARSQGFSIVLLAVLALTLSALACSGQSDRDTVTPSVAAPVKTAQPPAQPTRPPARTPTAMSRPLPVATFAPFPTRKPGAEARNSCGKYIVVRQDDAAQQGESVTLLAADGSVVQEWQPQAPGERYSVEWCFDVTGDGTPELMILGYSGGAHCCFTEELITLGSSPETRLTFEAGNGGALEPVELDGKPPYELTGYDDRLAYYADVPFAATSFFPIVFAWRDGRYAEATRDFPQVLKDDRAREVKRLKDCKGEDLCVRGSGLHILAVSLMLNDWDSAKTTFSIPRSALQWLDEHRAEVEETLSKPR